MVELGTRRTTERVRVGNSPPKATRVVLLSQPGVARLRGALANMNLMPCAQFIKWRKPLMIS